MATGYVNIKGRGLKFCQGSISELSQKLKSLSKDQMISWGGYWLAHFGLVGNCMVKGEDVTFDFENTVEWFETLTADEITQIKSAYDATQEYTKDIPDAAKKKIMKKK